MLTIMVNVSEHGLPDCPTPADLLALDIDLRLAELWSATSEVDHWHEEQLWALLRFAYGRGYHDALTESQRGRLCQEHGLLVPTPLHAEISGSTRCPRETRPDPSPATARRDLGGRLPFSNPGRS